MAEEWRCGWLVNPTPANWWLIDKDSTWTIYLQGGYYPDYTADIKSPIEFVAVNGPNYGYSCACLLVEVNKQDEAVLDILNSKPLPLKRCRDDPAIKNLEPLDDSE